MKLFLCEREDYLSSCTSEGVTKFHEVFVGYGWMISLDNNS